MAAAYAAVVSLMHLIEHIQLYHARRPIFLDGQLRQLEYLRETVSFLQDFLEIHANGGSHQTIVLESQITEAAGAAEDTIELHVVYGIQYPPNIDFAEGLQKILEDMDSIKREAMRIEDLIGSSLNDHHEEPQDVAPVGSLRCPLTENDTSLVFHDEKLIKILDKLTGQQSNIHTISITCVGGIGKTTLAKSIYDHQFIVNHFDCRGWVTISQEYDVGQVLLGILNVIGALTDQNVGKNLDSHQLGEKLHKHLIGRRYLIVLDDLWNVDAWDEINLFLPRQKESRVIVTTRISYVAKDIGSSMVHEIYLLDDNNSWTLLSRKISAHQSCPVELEEIGRLQKIAKDY